MALPAFLKSGKVCISFVLLFLHFFKHTCRIEISTGWFFSLVPPIFSTKKKIANQPITAAVPVNPVTKEGRDWLLGGFLFSTEIGEYQWKKSPCITILICENKNIFDFWFLQMVWWELELRKSALQICVFVWYDFDLSTYITILICEHKNIFNFYFFSNGQVGVWLEEVRIAYSYFLYDTIWICEMIIRILICNYHILWSFHLIFYFFKWSSRSWSGGSPHCRFVFFLHSRCGLCGGSNWSWWWPLWWWSSWWSWW